MIETKTQTEVTGDNQYQAVARHKKARKLAEAMRTLGVTDVSPEPTEEQLEAWAAFADSHVPSLVTWAVVREMLTEAG